MLRQVLIYASGALGLYALAVATLLAFRVYTSPQFVLSADLLWLCG